MRFIYICCLLYCVAACVALSVDPDAIVLRAATDGSHYRQTSLNVTLTLHGAALPSPGRYYPTMCVELLSNGRLSLCNN